MRPPARSAVLAVLPSILFVALGLLMFSSAGRDDSYISYWAADALAKLGQIVNYSGQRVEQSSSLGQILMLAGLARVVPLPMATLAPIVSILCGAAAVWMAQRLAAVSEPRYALAAAWVAATSAGFMYWSFSGLETSLAALLGVSLVFLYHRCLEVRRGAPPIAATAAATVAFLMIRPETIVVLTAVFVGTACVLWWRPVVVRMRRTAIPPSATAVVEAQADADRRFQIRRWRDLVFLIVATALVIVAFRVLYFGSPFPQPVAAKAHGISWDTLRIGAAYVRRHVLNGYGALTWAAFAVGMSVSAFAAFRHGLRAPADWLCAMFVTAYVLFAASSGGDWMELGRFLVPVAPMVAILAVRGIASVVPPRFVPAAVAVIVSCQLAGIYDAAAYRSYGMPIWRAASPRRAAMYPQLTFFEYANRLRDRDEPTAERLDQIVAANWSARHEPLTLMTGQAGFIGYRLGRHYGQFRLIDRYALVSREFTRCPVTASLPRGPFGLGLSYETFFRDREALLACGIPEPDVIFDIAHNNPRLHQLLRDHGYVDVFEQDQSAVEGPTWLRGATVYRDSFIAVRQELVAATTSR